MSGCARCGHDPGAQHLRAVDILPTPSVEASLDPTDPDDREAIVWAVERFDLCSPCVDELMLWIGGGS